MARKLEFGAADKKLGMSLAELKQAIDEAVGLAKINNTDENSAKATVLINWGGSIKTLWVEV